MITFMLHIAYHNKNDKEKYLPGGWGLTSVDNVFSLQTLEPMCNPKTLMENTRNAYNPRAGEAEAGGSLGLSSSQVSSMVNPRTESNTASRQGRQFPVTNTQKILHTHTQVPAR